MTIPKVNNLATTCNDLLMIAHRSQEKNNSKVESDRCRFDLFVRLSPGIVSFFPNQVRTWCYRGDKYTDQESKMLRNLLKLCVKNFSVYDRIVLYDHSNQGDEETILKIVDGVIEVNRIRVYSLMLLNYTLPLWLKSSD